MEKIEIEHIHCGQYKRYGDFFRVWKVKLHEDDIEKVRKYCLEKIYEKVVPEYEEWHKNIMYGGEKSNDASYYFTGYHKLEKKENENGKNVYVFTICEPYAD